MDIIATAQSAGFLSHLGIEILVGLDARSLLNCELVSSSWHAMVGEVWRGFYQRQKREWTLFQRYLKLRRLDRTLNLTTGDVSLYRVAAKITTDALSKLQDAWLTGPVFQELLETEDTITDVKLTPNHMIVVMHARNPFRITHFEDPYFIF